MSEITPELCEARLLSVNSNIHNVEQRLIGLIKRNSVIDNMSKEELKTSIETLLHATQKDILQLKNEIISIQEDVKICKVNKDEFTLLIHSEQMKVRSLEAKLIEIKTTVGEKIADLEKSSSAHITIVIKILLAILAVILLNFITGSWAETTKFILSIFS